MHDADAPVLQQGNFRGIHVHDMRENGAGTQQAAGVGVGHGTAAAAFETPGGFFRGFGQMDMQGQMQFFGQGGAGLERPGRRRVDAVRVDGHAQQRVVPPGFGQLPGGVQGRLRRGTAG